MYCGVLHKVKARVKLEKMKMGLEAVDFPGMQLSKHSWRVASKFFFAVKNLPRPQSLKELKDFIGTIS